MRREMLSISTRTFSRNFDDRSTTSAGAPRRLELLEQRVVQDGVDLPRHLVVSSEMSRSMPQTVGDRAVDADQKREVGPEAGRDELVLVVRRLNSCLARANLR